MIYIGYYNSPIGLIEIKTSEEFVLSVSFAEKQIIEFKNENKQTILSKTIKQLEEYFKGDRTEFSLPLDIQGTEFQKSVLDRVQKINYGTTNSYKDIATAINNEKAVRAVGNANNKNKLLIVIPCHRVIGSNGKLVGYVGGLQKKEWLLKHEEKFRNIL